MDADDAVDAFEQLDKWLNEQELQQWSVTPPQGVRQVAVREQEGEGCDGREGAARDFSECKFEGTKIMEGDKHEEGIIGGGHGEIKSGQRGGTVGRKRDGPPGMLGNAGRGGG